MKTAFDPALNRWTNDTVRRLPRHDLYFGTPVNSPTAGLPLGDGDRGSLLWPEKDGLHIHVNKTDLWQDAPAGVTSDDACFCSGREEALTAVCHGAEITLRFDAPVFEYLYQQRFHCRLSLSDATANLESETPFGNVSFSAFADAGTGVSFVTVKASFEDAAAPEVRLSRWGSRTLWRWYSQQQPSPETGLGGTDAQTENGRLYITQELNATKFCVALTLDVPPETCRRINRHTAGLTLPSGTAQAFTLLYTVQTGETAAAAKAACDNALDNALSAGAGARYAAHKAQWEAFWNRSYIALPDDYLENVYYLYLYTMNSESRGAYPPHFTSGLWSFYHDYVPWVYYFHYNMQHLYAPLDAAGHGELADNYYRMRRDGLAVARLYAGRVKHKKGAFVHDVTDRYGRGADYDSLNCTPLSQIAMQMYKHYRFTGDERFLRESVLPMMTAAAEFYLDMLSPGADGVYHLSGTTAYEGNPPTDDTLTDLVMVRALFSALLPHADAAFAERLRDVLAHLPPPLLLPPDLGDDWDGERFGFGLGKGKKPLGDGKVFGIGLRDGKPIRKMYGDPDSKKICYGFPDIELSPLYPAGVFGLKDRGTPLFDNMLNQLSLHRPGNAVGHWDLLPVFLARMGLGKEAVEAANGMLQGNQGFINGFNAEVGEPGSIVETPRRRYRFRNTDTEEMNEVAVDAFTHFDFETAPILALALQELLLQSHEGVVRVFPAYPGQKAACRLLAAGGFAVGAEFDGENLLVTVKSLLGNPLLLTLPLPADAALYAYTAKPGGAFAPAEIRQTETAYETVYDFSALQKEETLLLSTAPLEALETAAEPPAAPNADFKTNGPVCLGSPRLMAGAKTVL
ncbi:MAG: hypothetical protein IJJ85_05820 [Clostridia bacterium]|nr:hypothetical protein [Clostridia bacterium]